MNIDQFTMKWMKHLRSSKSLEKFQIKTNNFMVNHCKMILLWNALFSIINRIQLMRIIIISENKQAYKMKLD